MAPGSYVHVLITRTSEHGLARQRCGHIEPPRTSSPSDPASLPHVQGRRQTPGVWPLAQGHPGYRELQETRTLPRAIRRDETP